MLKSPLTDRNKYDELANAVARFSEPIHAQQLMVRIAALLTPYYNAHVPPSVRMIGADDWAEALSPYPEWAIVKACRWWKSKDNPERRKKPLEGDIAARAQNECGILRVAEGAMRRFERDGPQKPPEYLGNEPRVTAEKATEILKQAGYPKPGSNFAPKAPE